MPCNLTETGIRLTKSSSTVVLRAGIPEAWLVDVHAQTITVFAEPHAGGYGEERLLSRGQEIVSARVKGLRLQIDEAAG